MSFIYWDVQPWLYGICAGPEQRPAPISEAAVDLLVQMIRDNKSDEGKPQRCVLVEPVWRDGPSLRERELSLMMKPGFGISGGWTGLI